MSTKDTKKQMLNDRMTKLKSWINLSQKPHCSAKNSLISNNEDKLKREIKPLLIRGWAVFI